MVDKSLSKHIISIQTPNQMIKTFMFYINTAGWHNYGRHNDIDIEPGNPGDFQLIYIVKGCGFVETTQSTYKVKQGQVILLDLSYEHRLFCNSNDSFEIIWMQYSGMQAQHYFEFLGATQYPIYDTLASNGIFHNLFTHILNLFKMHTVNSEIEISAIIHQILCKMALIQRNDTYKFINVSEVNEYKNRHETYSPVAVADREEIRRGINFIKKNYNKPITLAQTAKEATISKYHFTRLLKLSTGYSFSEYLINHRINEAEILLISTDLGICEVAKHIGIADCGYFSRLFKQRKNISPNRYRQTNR